MVHSEMYFLNGRIRSIKHWRFVIIILILIRPGSSFAQKADSVLTEKYIELREIKVIGQRTTTVYETLARKVTIITPDETGSSPASTIQDLLDYAAGVDIRQRNVHGVQADIHLRGGTFDEVMVLLNGINISDPQTGHFNLDLPVELSSVERIEILHGSGARIYGPNAYKGVINIVTKKNSDQLTAGVYYGQHNLFHSNVAGGFSIGKFYNSLSLSRNTSVGYTENTDYRISHLFYQGGINAKKVSLFFQGGLNGKAFGANDFYSPMFPEQFEETSARFGSIGLNTRGKINISLAGFWRRHNDHFLLKRSNPEFYENFHQTDIYGIKGDADFSSVIGKTSVGVEARSENILSSRLGEILASPVRIKGKDSSFYTNYFERNTFSYFIEHNYRTGKFSFTGGLLLNWNNNYRNKFDFFPGLDVGCNIFDDRVKLFVSINKALRLPTFTDMFYKDPSNEGNRDLEPEQLLAFETGAEYNIKNFSAGFTLFRDNGKNVVDWVWLNDRKLYKAMNIAEITARGIEISTDYCCPNINKPFQLKNIGTSYELIGLLKATSDFVSKYSLDFLKHKFRFYTTYGLTKAITATLHVSYLSRNGSYLDYDSLTGTLFPSSFKPYWLADIKLSYNNRDFQVYIEATNLFDKAYTDVGSLILPGRWIIAGIQFTVSKNQLHISK